MTIPMVSTFNTVNMLLMVEDLRTPQATITVNSDMILLKWYFLLLKLRNVKRMRYIYFLSKRVFILCVITGT